MKTHSTGGLTPEDVSRQESRYKEGHQYDYLVIGTGMSALSTSCLLAKAGLRVCMLEAHDIPGGYVHTFKMGDYRFCAQVHYIWGCGPGERIHEFLKHLGLENEITFESFDPSGYDHAVMPDGNRVRIPYGWENLARSIENTYPGQYEAVRRFTGILERIHGEISALPEHIHWYDMFKFPRFLGLLKYRNATLEQVFDECELSREARAVLGANTGNFMCPPNRLSIFAYTALMAGYDRGAYYPKKHFRFMVDRLVKYITDHDGCHVYYQTEVTKIDVERDEVTSVETRCGKTFKTPRILCNMDPQAASRLIGREKFPAASLPALSYEYSHTAVTVYLGLKGIDLREHGFGRYNIWHLGQWDINRIWEQALEGSWEQPWMFMSTPTLHTDDAGNAPPGGQILELATGASYKMFRELKDRDSKAYLQLKNRVRDRLIDLVEEKYVPGLRSHIAVKVTGSPTTNEDFCGAPEGHAYGQQLTPANMGIGRLKAPSPWKNLFWCSAASGYAGVNGTIGTGMQLYMALTQDQPFDMSKLPPTEVMQAYARDLAAR